MGPGPRMCPRDSSRGVSAPSAQTKGAKDLPWCLISALAPGPARSSPPLARGRGGDGFSAKRSEIAGLTARDWRFARAQGAEPLPPLAGEDWGGSESESDRDTIGPAVITTHSDRLRSNLSSHCSRLCCGQRRRSPSACARRPGRRRLATPQAIRPTSGTGDLHGRRAARRPGRRRLAAPPAKPCDSAHERGAQHALAHLLC